MPDAPLSHLEDARLSALDDLKLLDGRASPEFDIFPLLASQILATPIAAITLVGRDMQWIKAGVGISGAAPRSHSICEYAILQPSDVLTIQDTRLDSRVFDKPCVAVDGGIRSYAGVAISGPTGLPLGTLCVADKVPRSFSAAELAKLRELAGGVESAVKLHAAMAQEGRRAGADPAGSAAGQIASELKTFIGTVVTPIVKSSFRDSKAKLLLTSMFARIDAPVMLVDSSSNIMMANSAFRALVGFSPDELKIMRLDHFINPFVGDAAGAHDQRFETGQVYRATCDVKTKSGASVAVTLTSVVVDFDHHLYKVITIIPAGSRLEQSELSAEFKLYASQSVGEFRPISLAALRSALGDAWSRVSLRAMLSAERIIRKRLDRDDVVTRLDEETFAVWFNNGNRLQNDEALTVINRDLRVRLLTEFGDELKKYLQNSVSPEEETLVGEPVVAA